MHLGDDVQEFNNVGIVDRLQGRDLPQGISFWICEPCWASCRPFNVYLLQGHLGPSGAMYSLLDLQIFENEYFI